MQRRLTTVVSADVAGYSRLMERDDGGALAPFDPGRGFARDIPDARFVALDGANHVRLEREPAWPRFVGEVRDVLTEHADA